MDWLLSNRRLSACFERPYRGPIPAGWGGSDKKEGQMWSHRFRKYIDSGLASSV